MMNPDVGLAVTNQVRQDRATHEPLHKPGQTAAICGDF